MSAKPRVTVRLAPSTLHQLAYLSERHTTPPAEMARTILTAWCQDQLRAPGQQTDWQRAYNAWLDEQAARSDRAEAPDQSDYDRLATSPAAQRVVPAHQERKAQGAYSSLVTPALPGVDLPPLASTESVAPWAAELYHKDAQGRTRRVK
jgi:hypothetical protein